ncbi:hypothetical protein O3P69_003297 [Scylla paramamosain]|uniref:FAM86 N-terminal domain-containing protein n=1 Tax=Scylla paramamosain TaxID=85552 RepID=A0AAW0UNI6_SCYPA
MSCELINRAHLAGVSTSHAVWRHFAATLDVSYQEQPPQHFVDEILDASIRNPCALAAPRDPTHTREVVAWLAEQWRLRGWTVPSEFQLESLPDADYTVDLFYKTYTGWGGGTLGTGVTLMESSGGITSSTTGLTTWCGAAVLAEWVANNPTVVAGKRVLELGAGVGFSASAILTSPDTEHPPPAAYFATDCHHQVLTLLHHNLTLNLADPPLQRTYLEEFRAKVIHQLEKERLVTPEEKYEEPLVWSPPAATITDPAHPTLAVVREEEHGQNRVGVMQVDWRHPPRLPAVDVVLAADVVYCHNLIQPLVSLLRSILKGSDRQEERGHLQQEPLRGNGRKGCSSEEEVRATNGGGPGKQEAFLACTRRSHETLSLFLQEVTRQGLHYTLVFQATMDADTALFVYNEIHLPVKVYKITLPQEDTQKH